MAPAITVRDLSYSYFDGSQRALSSCSFSVQPGSCCAVLGPSGSGKTTLLQILSGIAGSQIATGIASGSITIGDQLFSPLPLQPLFPFVGYSMPDPLTQLSGIKDTVADEIAFTLDNLRISEPEHSRRLGVVLEQLGLLHLAGRHPMTLSGGEIQRVALASILVGSPSLLLLDEPSNALDSRGQQKLVQVVRSLKDGSTVVVADHQIDFALSVADQFIVIDSGVVVFNADKREFLRSLDGFKHLLPVRFRSELSAAPRTLRSIIQRIVFP